MISDGGGVLQRVFVRCHRALVDLRKIDVDPSDFKIFVSIDIWHEILREHRHVGQPRVGGLPVELDRTLPDNSIRLRYEVEA